MLSQKELRLWISPVTSVSFVVMALTGCLMFFGVRARLINGVHEWMGLLFVVFGLVHLMLNWGQLVSYFTLRAARLALIGAVVMCILIALSAGQGEHKRRIERQNSSLPPAPLVAKD